MDTIKIENLEVFAKHGVFKEENVLGQKFAVSCEIRTDIHKAGVSDNLEHSVDYGSICHFIKRLMEQNTFNLIEKAAESIAENILIDYNFVDSIKVEVKKPWAPIMIPADFVSVTIERNWHTAYLSLGSNIGDKENYIKNAIEVINKNNKCNVIKMADIIATKPYGVTGQADFLNTCLELKTLFTPVELLNFVNQIEADNDRVREKRWGPRTLDIDIIFYDDLIIQNERLIIPHIESHLREFVLKPLNQIAPFKIHPVFKKPVCTLLKDLNLNNL